MSFVIQKNVSLQRYNTLALPGRAEYFCDICSMDALEEALAFARQQNLAVTPLGGGSNIVLAGNIAGLVLHVNLSGLQAVCNDEAGVIDVAVAAGENWHQTVITCLQNGWYGLENLSLIPGNAGAAPIQNIGAYGVELSDRFHSLHAVDLASGEIVTLDREQCHFGYRDSIFKGELRDRLLITQINLSLTKQPQLVLDYPALRDQLGAAHDTTPLQVSEAVCALRSSKLPDPAKIANAGSFFKNPVIAQAQFKGLRAAYPQLPAFPQSNGDIKIPAGWLIEQSGFKGVVRGAVGVHDKQALVLVNHGGGTGRELLALADEIRAEVKHRFAVDLEIEPRVYAD